MDVDHGKDEERIFCAALELTSPTARAAYVQEALCKGCGSCAVACPTGAASIYHFDDQEVLTMVEAALD